MRKGLQTILLLVMLTTLVQAQGFWVKTDYQKWSAKECVKMLSDSPWAKSQIVSTFQMELLTAESSMPRNLPHPRLTYVAQLWSALPIRQAAVRHNRMSAGYDKLTASDRQVLESRQTAVLAEEFPDHIVIHVNYSINISSLVKAMAIHWQTRSLGDWRQDTFLITSTGRHPPTEVKVASGVGGQFELVFPRRLEGRTIVSDSDDSFALEFPSPAIGQAPSERVFLQFRLKDMSMNGRPVF